MKTLIALLLLSTSSMASSVAAGKTYTVCEEGNCKEVSIYDSAKKEPTLADMQTGSCFIREDKGENQYCSVLSVKGREVKFVCEKPTEDYMLYRVVMLYGKSKTFDYSMRQIPCSQAPRLGEANYISSCTKGMNKTKYYCPSPNR
ncbi:MAG: hypothetical protein H6622_13225 [Halobacteriovoraceae bacterium]|nr:hypothetical protein [Halobacteriovoraceae bacterium]